MIYVFSDLHFDAFHRNYSGFYSFGFPFMIVEPKIDNNAPWCIKINIIHFLMKF